MPLQNSASRLNLWNKAATSLIGSTLLAGAFVISGQALGASFNDPLPTLTDAELAEHLHGDSLSDAKYVTAPAPVYGGLGPLYNNNSCTGCHRSDGRGLPTLVPGSGNSNLIIKVSLPTGAGTPEEPNGDIPVPGIGIQIQDQGIYGVTPPATGRLTWTEHSVAFADGTKVELRQPKLDISWAAGSPPAPAILTSLRLPPAFFGLGLLEGVSEEDLRQSEQDSHNPGRVPGRLNEVWSRTEQKVMVGRFGRKANKALVRDQVALALALDIGLENSLFPGPGGRTKVSDDTLNALTFYVRTLKGPEPRTASDPAAVRGQAVFRRIGCNGCHLETMKTAPNLDPPALSDQVFHPYTDLLLHDMGPDLADHRPDFLANGQEWRTPPLWGVGLQSTVLPYACFLHDGRARSVTEAILWHGGEAYGRREAFRQLPVSERQDLLAFLRSL